MGWGATPWGLGPWGVGGAGSLQLLFALAVRENVVRLWFNEAPIFTGVLDPSDASDASRYNIVSVAGTMADGSTPRTIFPILAERYAEEMALGRIIDVTFDRHLDGYPGRYLISVNQLISAETGVVLDPTHTAFLIDGLVQETRIKTRDVAVPVRDIANPQTLGALLDPLPETRVGMLGSYPANVDGDYAADEGFTSYKKRIFRRITTRKNAFSHLPGYGVILLSRMKRLGLASVRAECAADLKAQVMEEPETINASVVIVPDVPGLWRVRMKVQSTLSDKPIDFDLPFSVNG